MGRFSAHAARVALYLTAWASQLPILRICDEECVWTAGLSSLWHETRTSDMPISRASFMPVNIPEDAPGAKMKSVCGPAALGWEIRPTTQRGPFGFAQGALSGRSQIQLAQRRRGAEKSAITAPSKLGVPASLRETYIMPLVSNRQVGWADFLPMRLGWCCI
jgi:hypothetical protein